MQLTTCFHTFLIATDFYGAYHIFLTSFDLSLGNGTVSLPCHSGSVFVGRDSKVPGGVCCWKMEEGCWPLRPKERCVTLIWSALIVIPISIVIFSLFVYQSCLEQSSLLPKSLINKIFILCKSFTNTKRFL